MKIRQFISILLVIPALLLFGLSACRKDNSLGFTPGTGAPTITAVHTWSKKDTSNDSTIVTTYDPAGNPKTSVKLRGGQPEPFDSLTTAGNLGSYYLIEGTNLGSATSVSFNGATAYFNRGLMTDHSIIVQIPSNAPYYGPQATDSLVIATLHGKAFYKFSIIPPPPTLAAVSDYNFSTASQITLTGIGFASVTAVGLSGTSATCKIIAQTDTVMTVQFPSTTVTTANLVFTYREGTVTATQEMVNIDHAYQIFTDDYQNGWGSWSWGTAGPSTLTAKAGTTSFSALFGAGAWWIDGFRQGGGGAADGAPYSAGYQYLSFWVKGGSAKETIYIEFGNNGFGNGGANQINSYDVPAGVWTYFKIPISSLLWNTSATTWAANSSSLLSTVAFFMSGNSVDETLYFDDVILVK